MIINYNDKNKEQLEVFSDWKQTIPVKTLITPAGMRVSITTGNVAIARLDRTLCSNRIVSMTTNVCKSSILLCRCETWTLPADKENKMQAFDIAFLSMLLGISYMKPKTTDFVRSVFANLVDYQDPHLTTPKRRKQVWFSYITRLTMNSN